MSKSIKLCTTLGKRATILVLICYIILPFVSAQSFHKALDNPENLFSQRILRNADGSYLIGDSFLTNGEIYISRFFKCGEVDWSRSYQIGGAFIEFRDFEFTSSGDLIAFGSYFVGNKELIFVQKIDQNTGVQISFSTMDPVYQDHFTYSIDIVNGEIILYGLLLDFNIDRRGFLVVLDEGLNVKWAKDFSPFEKEGAAVIANDGFYCRSEKYHMKFTLNGDVAWSKTLESSNMQMIPIGGPINVSDGNIYEASVDGRNFFYKLDRLGALAWKSELFSSTGDRSALNQLNDQSFLITYYGKVNSETVLAQMELSSAGILTNQRYFDSPEAFASGTVQVSLFEDYMTIVGSPEPFTNFPNAHQDFIIQVNTSQEAMCYPEIQYNDFIINNIDLSLNDYQVTVEDFGLLGVASSSITFDTYDIGLTVLCTEVPEPIVINDFYQLECGSSVELNLPDADFIWDDLGTSEVRTESQPGVYEARSTDCENTTILTYTLTTPDCECKVYFPSAISPNEDGFNDQLEYFSDCTINSIRVSVYNRWGEKVFDNNVVGQFWRAEKASNGVYIVQGKYELVGPNGLLIEKEFNQSVTVLK